jgi:hypothetical protein
LFISVYARPYAVCSIKLTQNALFNFILFRELDNEELHDAWERRRMHIGYAWESQKEGDHSEDLDVGGWTILKWILER